MILDGRPQNLLKSPPHKSIPADSSIPYEPRPSMSMGVILHNHITPVILHMLTCSIGCVSTSQPVTASITQHLSRHPYSDIFRQHSLRHSDVDSERQSPPTYVPSLHFY